MAKRLNTLVGEMPLEVLSHGKKLDCQCLLKEWIVDFDYPL